MRVARIFVGVTGGIAAYKACELVRLLVRAGHDVTPITTAGAERFVAGETFWALARKERPADPYPHLAAADVLVVAPLTANTLARLAHGHADDLLTETALAHRGPLVVAPAMNTAMWEHPATRANMSLLVERGAEVVGPAEGELARGARRDGADERARGDRGARRGAPRPLERDESDSSPLSARHVLVTAGGTREPLDQVRFVGNRSSGRMGVALAEAARDRGAQVTILAANLQVPAPAGVEVVTTPTAADLRREALARADADVVLMAAAVSDYRPAEALAGKRPKDADPWTVDLVPTADVARALGAARGDGQVLVAFGAESGEDGLARKRAMLTDKDVDLVVYNDVGRDDIGFEAGTTRSCSSRAKASGRSRRRRSARSRTDPRRDRAPARASAVSEGVAALGSGGRTMPPRSRRVWSRTCPRPSTRLGDAPAAAALPPLRGPRARRGRPRCGQDGAGQGARPLARRSVPPDAVHARPASGGCHGRQRLRPRRAARSGSGPGPVFANVLLVDEINRASPKTQSALLEAMQETQVTVDGATHALERPFLVIATQNPVEYEGTYPLPEAQLDRFAVRMTIGYPPHADEARMLAEQTTEPPLDHLVPVARHAELLDAIEAVRARARGGDRQPVRRRPPAPHAGEHAGSRSAAARGRGSRSCASRRPARCRAARLRRAGGRPSACAARPRPPPDPRAGGPRDRRDR